MTEHAPGEGTTNYDKERRAWERAVEYRDKLVEELRKHKLRATHKERVKDLEHRLTTVVSRDYVLQLRKENGYAPRKGNRSRSDFGTV